MNKKQLTIIFTACLSFALIVFSYAFADLKAYYEDLDSDGHLETVTVHQTYFTSDNMPPFAEEGIVTVYDADLEKAVSFSMPEHMGEIEFVSLNKDGFKQIVAWSNSGMHYTNLAIYGYKDGALYRIFKDGSACLVETYFNKTNATIKVGRANWEKEGWSYASGGHGDSLWEVYEWNGKEFIYNKALSTAPEISEQEELQRFLDKAKSLMEDNE